MGALIRGSVWPQECRSKHTAALVTPPHLVVTSTNLMERNVLQLLSCIPFCCAVFCAGNIQLANFGSADMEQLLQGANLQELALGNQLLMPGGMDTALAGPQATLLRLLDSPAFLEQVAAGMQALQNDPEQQQQQQPPQPSNQQQQPHQQQPSDQQGQQQGSPSDEANQS